MDYYDENGVSVKKFLMKMFVDGVCFILWFGMCKYFIFGYFKMYKGMDFVVLCGILVMVVGNGIVEVVKWFGGYGNYICICYVNGYKIVYVYLKGYVCGIKFGVWVK